MPNQLRRVLSLVLSFCFLFQQASFAQVAAELNLGSYFSRVGSQLTQEKFRPLHLRYFSYDNASDNFKVLLDKGDALKGLSPNANQEVIKGTVPTLLNYFLVGVSLPDSLFWVNLRPDAQDQIIDPALEKTDIGKIMLEADLQLKKDTAALTSPRTAEGKAYWAKLYKKAAELYGNDNTSIPTLTRPWIVPGEVIVRETKDSAYVYKAGLKVMLEQDYLKDSSVYDFPDARSQALNEYSSQLIRELIIPKLTRDVNSAKRYSALRQVYYSLILSRWFKLRFTGKEGTYSKLINTANLANLTSSTSWSKSTYFNAYKKSFADGEYNISEPVSTPTGQVIRTYFSGGIQIGTGAINTQNGFTALGAPRVMPGIAQEGNAKTGAVSPVANRFKFTGKLIDLWEKSDDGSLSVLLSDGLDGEITLGVISDNILDDGKEVRGILEGRSGGKIEYVVPLSKETGSNLVGGEIVLGMADQLREILGNDVILSGGILNARGSASPVELGNQAIGISENARKSWQDISDLMARLEPEFRKFGSALLSEDVGDLAGLIKDHGVVEAQNQLAVFESKIKLLKNGGAKADDAFCAELLESVATAQTAMFEMVYRNLAVMADFLQPYTKEGGQIKPPENLRDISNEIGEFVKQVGVKHRIKQDFDYFEQLRKIIEDLKDVAPDVSSSERNGAITAMGLFNEFIGVKQAALKVSDVRRSIDEQVFMQEFIAYGIKNYQRLTLHGEDFPETAQLIAKKYYSSSASPIKDIAKLFEVLSFQAANQDVSVAALNIANALYSFHPPQVSQAQLDMLITKLGAIVVPADDKAGALLAKRNVAQAIKLAFLSNIDLKLTAEQEQVVRAAYNTAPFGEISRAKRALSGVLDVWERYKGRVPGIKSAAGSPLTGTNSGIAPASASPISKEQCAEFFRERIADQDVAVYGLKADAADALSHIGLLPDEKEREKLQKYFEHLAYQEKLASDPGMIIAHIGLVALGVGDKKEHQQFFKEMLLKDRRDTEIIALARIGLIQTGYVVDMALQGDLEGYFTELALKDGNEKRSSIKNALGYMGLAMLSPRIEDFISDINTPGLDESEITGAYLGLAISSWPESFGVSAASPLRSAALEKDAVHQEIDRLTGVINLSADLMRNSYQEMEGNFELIAGYEKEIVRGSAKETAELLAKIAGLKEKNQQILAEILTIGTKIEQNEHQLMIQRNRALMDPAAASPLSGVKVMDAQWSKWYKAKSVLNVKVGGYLPFKATVNYLTGSLVSFLLPEEDNRQYAVLREKIIEIKPVADDWVYAEGRLSNLTAISSDRNLKVTLGPPISLNRIMVNVSATGEERVGSYNHEHADLTATVTISGKNGNSRQVSFPLEGGYPLTLGLDGQKIIGDYQELKDYLGEDVVLYASLKSTPVASVASRKHNASWRTMKRKQQLAKLRGLAGAGLYVAMQFTRYGSRHPERGVGRLIRLERIRPGVDNWDVTVRLKNYNGGKDETIKVLLTSIADLSVVTWPHDKIAQLEKDFDQAVKAEAAYGSRYRHGHGWSSAVLFNAARAKRMALRAQIEELKGAAASPLRSSDQFAASSKIISAIIEDKFKSQLPLGKQALLKKMMRYLSAVTMPVALNKPENKDEPPILKTGDKAELQVLKGEVEMVWKGLSSLGTRVDIRSPQEDRLISDLFLRFSAILMYFTGEIESSYRRSNFAAPEKSAAGHPATRKSFPAGSPNKKSFVVASSPVVSKPTQGDFEIWRDANVILTVDWDGKKKHGLQASGKVVFVRSENKEIYVGLRLTGQALRYIPLSSITGAKVISRAPITTDTPWEKLNNAQRLERLKSLEGTEKYFTMRFHREGNARGEAAQCKVVGMLKHPFGYWEVILGFKDKIGTVAATDKIFFSGINYVGTSSPLAAPENTQDEGVGGIDFRAFRNISIQPMGSFKGLNLQLPKLSQAVLDKIVLGREMQQVKNMVEQGIVPSGQRIKELIAACVQKGELNAYSDSLLVCLADICKLQEESASETSTELKEALVLLDARG